VKILIFEPREVELVHAEVGGDAPVGGHRARTVRPDERDDRPRTALDDGTTDLDAVTLERATGRPSRLVVRCLADEPRVPAQLGDPCGHVRGLAPWAELRHRVGVRSLRQGLAEADDHVQEQVADGDDHAYDPSMDEESRRSRTRSFLVGAAVGASAAIAAARKLRPKERRRDTPAGLAAFEEAPCYRELVESERAAP
jgi:hypothetical protein